jgi:DNA-binding response OmpR family regulator
LERILIVDADRKRRDRLTFLLRHMGYAVDVRPNGSHGGDSAVREPDLVLLSEQVLRCHAGDVMPWIVGYFTGPKIVIGVEPEEVAGVPYLEMGADAYMPAPLDVRLLLARVRTMLGRHSHSVDYAEWPELRRTCVRRESLVWRGGGAD